MLVTAGELLQDADRRGYAVGAFNVHTLEMLPPVVAVAEELSAPIILQFTPGSVTFIGPHTLAAVTRELAAHTRVPIAVHLDHADQIDQILLALRHGFTSVMIDGSRLTFDENVALTRRVVALARPVGVTVEAEMGRVGGTEEQISLPEHEARLSDPDEARAFADATGLDYLAVAIGTAHGFYRGEPHLDLDRLAAIDARVTVPLVLHGGSGVPIPAVQAAIARGIRKVNVATELKDAWARALRSVLADHAEEIDPRRLLRPAREAVAAVVRTKIQAFGAEGKA